MTRFTQSNSRNPMNGGEALRHSFENVPAMVAGHRLDVANKAVSALDTATKKWRKEEVMRATYGPAMYDQVTFQAPMQNSVVDQAGRDQAHAATMEARAADDVAAIYAGMEGRPAAQPDAYTAVMGNQGANRV